MRNPLRVELRDGRAYELVDVVIATDSLFGSANDPSRVRSAFHLSQIARLEELRDDNRRTIGLIVLIAVLGAMGGLTGF